MNDDFETLPPETLSPADLDEALAATERQWSDELAVILAPPPDLTDRCADEVRAALLTRSVVATGTDLLSVGWQTVRLLLSSDPTPPQRVSRFTPELVRPDVPRPPDTSPPEQP